MPARFWSHRPPRLNRLLHFPVSHCHQSRIGHLARPLHVRLSIRHHCLQSFRVGSREAVFVVLVRRGFPSAKCFNKRWKPVELLILIFWYLIILHICASAQPGTRSLEAYYPLHTTRTANQAIRMASGEPHSPLWLGLDLSTQSLTLVLLPDEPGRPHVYLDSIVYARDLPQYQTEHGMHISNGDDGEKVGRTLSRGSGSSY